MLVFVSRIGRKKNDFLLFRNLLVSGLKANFDNARNENIDLRDESNLINWNVNNWWKENYDPITHAYVHWLADVHFAVFAPAFPFVALRQEIRPQTANAHSLSRYGL